MNNKIICRIASNIYHIYDAENPLSDELDSLKSGRMSNNIILNNLYLLFILIIKNNGKINYNELLNKVEKNFSNKFIVNRKENVELMYLYYRNDCVKFSDKFTKSDVIIGDEKFKYILLGILLNTIQYRATGEMYIYHPNVLYSFKYSSSHRQIILNAKEETMYYLQKKVIFSIKNIKESINIFFKEYPIFDNLINTVYLFGSYAKNKNDEYSDVDLFFEFKKKDENIILFEQLIKNFMKTRFNMDIDVLIHFKGENFNNFENKILSYSVKLK